MTSNPLLAHLLATLRYRTRTALNDAPPGFEDFEAGHGSRTPAQLLRHMHILISYTLKALGETADTAPADWSMAKVLADFERTLAALNRVFGSSELSEEQSKRLLQGPLCDAMTHAGQLSMLRRLAGSPVPGQNFYEADIHASDLV